MNDNDGYMTIKTDYRILYIGNLNEFFFLFISSFYMNVGKKRNKQLSWVTLLNLAREKGQMFVFCKM